MKLYLDDDAASHLLSRLLTNAGHDVLLPAAAAMSGKKDAVHFTYAVRSGRTILTRNYGDFEDLHDLAMALQGRHPGIFLVRMDNDPRRDLKPHEIVRAITKLLASGLPIADTVHVLNQWR
jgi:predicted nuclease of predicted toxin-antitoxin system